MAGKEFTIVYSNYTMQLFAWPGKPADVRKFLGNREVMGAIYANDAEDAMSKWKAQVA